MLLPSEPELLPVLELEPEPVLLPEPVLPVSVPVRMLEEPVLLEEVLPPQLVAKEASMATARTEAKIFLFMEMSP